LSATVAPVTCIDPPDAIDSNPLVNFAVCAGISFPLTVTVPEQLKLVENVTVEPALTLMVGNVVATEPEIVWFVPLNMIDWPELAL
jgi:hypothetical protein